MTIELRPYQDYLVGDIRTALKSYRRVLAESPTGSGKTQIGTYIVHGVSQRGMNCMFLVHRTELMRQTSRAFEKQGIAHETIESGRGFNPHHNVYIGAIQTVANRIARIPKIDLLIVDECFPAGTLIDGIPIEQIKTGDFVRSFDEVTNQIVRRKVCRVMRKSTSRIVVIKFTNGEILKCTPNHPIFTTKGWKNAEEITRTCEIYCDPLFSMQNRSQIHRGAQVLHLEEKPKDILLKRLSRCDYSARIINQNGENKSYSRFCKNDFEQSNEKRREPKKNVRYFAKNRPQAAYSRRERNWFNAPASDAFEGIGRTVEARESDSNKNAKRFGFSNLLQIRCWTQNFANWCRNRWERPWRNRKARKGFEKNEVLGVVGVQSIEIYEQGNHERFEELCPNNIVYNFEVEGTHTYFANGIAIHNCHHANSPSWAATIEALNPRWIIGLSATPCRLDGKGLSESFDTIVHGPAVADLIEMGFLSPYRIFAPSSVDLTGVKTTAGDYNRSDIDKLMDKPKIIGDAVAHYSKFTPNARAVVFCTSILHANHVAEHFSASGFNAASVDGKMAKGERSEVLRKFEAGEIRVLTSCDLVSEGFDLPNIEVAISLRPTASLSLWLQQVGRCLRIAEGKDCAIILDHVGNTLRHGLPDERREWTLNPKKKKASRGNRDDAAEVNIKCCEKCFMVHKPAPICPHCGHVHPIVTREIEQVDGELVELDAARIKREVRIEQGRAQTLEELKAIEISRGYKNGWAWHIFNSRNKKSGAA